MLPDFPRFVKCPSCSIFYDIDDGTIRSHYHSDDPDESDIPFVKFLTLGECLLAIETGLANGDSESMLMLRMELWRKFNDSIRAGGDIEDTVKYEDNCRELLSELESRSDDLAVLMCAELWRNIGEFSKSKETLKDIRASDDFENYIRVIGEACDTGNKRTICVSNGRE
jgi:hypothetical protein